MAESQTITVACKLKASKEAAREIDDTLSTFNSACEWANQNVPPKLANKTAMQSFVYQQVRAMQLLL